jgi:hypothetical protein
MLNNQAVSKGYGPNKKEAKSNAVNMLLKVMCPKIYSEWNEKLRTHKFNINPNAPQLHEKLALEERVCHPSTAVDSEMIIEYSDDGKVPPENEQRLEVSNEKENLSPD